MLLQTAAASANSAAYVENPRPVIHVVDDDESVRGALARRLQADGYDTRAYGTAGEFLAAERADAPGCVILDVRLPGQSGFDLHAALSKEENPLPVIFLTGHGSIPMSVQAMKAGAVDFLTKPFRDDALMGAVGAALSRSETERRSAERRRVLRSRYEKLTGRERAVFARVVRGHLNKQIAAELGTCERTVKAHRAKVMEKMCARSVADLVRAADQLRS
jgi:FixJ family two-component response regulator